MGKKGQHLLQRQPSIRQLKSTLAVQVILYRQVAAARKLPLAFAKILLCGMRRVIQSIFRLKPALATAVIVVTPLVVPTVCSANSFIKRDGTGNPFTSIDVGKFSIPSFADIDNDGDLDLFIGADSGLFHFYKNTGTPTNATYQVQGGTDNPLNGFDVGEYSTPRLADLDDDGVLDAISGEFTGKVLYYKNMGTAMVPNFLNQTGTQNPLDDVNVLKTSSPTLADIDADSDLDAFIGKNDGTIVYYQNNGDSQNPSFENRTGTLNPFDTIDIGSYSIPTFADIDGDGDLDAFIGELSDADEYGDRILFFENTGNKNSPAFENRTGSANPLDGLFLGYYGSAPVFADIDGDGDLDLVSGESYGKILYFENVGSDPMFTSMPITNAFIGLEYMYTAQAIDPDATEVTFSKVNGPTWLAVSPSGVVAGTPPEDAIGGFEITIRATDSGVLTRSVEQTFTLQVTASFEGWQNQNFDLPADAALAEAMANPDTDNLPNLIEYALRLNPNIADSNPLPQPLVDEGGHLSISIDIRDDDPGLTVVAEVSDTPDFAVIDQIIGVETDPDPNDGFKTLTFTDTEVISTTNQRFLRLRFSITP